jgi:hypothetical protein
VQPVERASPHSNWIGDDFQTRQRLLLEFFRTSGREPGKLHLRIPPILEIPLRVNVSGSLLQTKLCLREIFKSRKQNEVIPASPLVGSGKLFWTLLPIVTRSRANLPRSGYGGVADNTGLSAFSKHYGVVGVRG